MAKVKKTNAMRMLDKAKIKYDLIHYEVEDGKIDGISVALKVNKDVNSVFKTLVTEGKSGEHYVFVIPVSEELDLKKAAKVSGEKSINMLPSKNLLPLTGYIHGGCSPVGMKKKLKTFIHDSINNISEITVSGGKRGIQVCLAPDKLIGVVDGEKASVTVG